MLAPGYAKDQAAIGAHELPILATPILGAPILGAPILGAQIIVDHVGGIPGMALSPSLSQGLAPGLQGGGPDNSPAVTIGGRIRTLRRARGLTQDTLASSTGVSRSAVAQWETGRAGQMAGKLRRIAEALGVSVSMLKEGWEGLATDSVLSAEEMSLLRLFRRCPAEDRMVLMHVAQKLAANPAAEAEISA